jgi:hypothetical protein
MTIELRKHAEGVIVRVRAQSRARRTGITGEHGGALRIAVAEAPEKGRANLAIIELLCRELDLARSQVRLISGETTRDKRFLLTGVEPAELRARLASSAPPRGTKRR